ncbi:MAG: helix-turn-helix domain-containing protein [Treponema sp.]|nr:helix-turn-helix domain-containing protein [Treponema sp.]
MEQYQVGKLLKEYRKRKNISQEELCGTTCAVSTLSRIESGTQVPDRKLIQVFFERLGMSVPPLDIPMNKTDFERYNLEIQISTKISNNDYEIAELLNLYASFKQQMTVLEKQFYEYASAVYEMRHYYDNKLVLQHFCDAITLTIKDFTLEINLESYLFSQRELFILNNIAITEYYMGFHKKAIARMEFLKNYFDIHDIAEKEKAVSYKYFLFHLSNWYGTEGNSQKSLEFADEGIQICNRYGGLHLYPYLVFNKGYALAELGQKEEGKNYIKMAFDMMNLLGFKKDLEYGMENVKKTFGFDYT